VKRSQWMVLIRNFAIELLIYAGLVVGYFYGVLRLLGEPLKRLYENNLLLFALVALMLMVTQAVILEAVTSFIVNQLGLERLE
jgi:hypothetical protein